MPKNFRLNLGLAEYTKQPHYAFTRFGHLRAHEVTDPVMTRDILKQDNTFMVPVFVRETFGQFVGKALMFDEGESWKNTHSLMKTVFSKQNVLTKIAPAFVEQCERMTDRWLTEGRPLDIDHEMRSLTARAIMHALFTDGISTRQADRIIDLAEAAMLSFRNPSLRYILSRATGRTEEEQRKHIEPLNATCRTAARGIEVILNDVIDRRRAALKADADKPVDAQDILDRLILEGMDARTGLPLGNRQIQDQLLLLIMAGHETNSATLTFAISELLQNPAEAEKLRRETDAITGGTRGIEAADYMKLAAAKNAFQEALRRYPSAHEILREAYADASFGGIHCKKGDLLNINILRMHRDPDYWHDPLSFRPDRHGKDAPREPWSEKNLPTPFMPFGGGPRTCIGMVLAMSTGTIALAKIFNSVNLKVTRPLDGEKLLFTLQPKGRLEAVPGPRI